MQAVDKIDEKWPRPEPGHLLRLFSRRLVDRRFWVIQGLVAAITGLHWVGEASGVFNELHNFSGAPVILYLVPVIYASLHYGFEGAVLTGLWSTVLSAPNVAMWHRSDLEWVGELAQLVAMVSVGVLMAWRVELEAASRQRAEKTSARLALLNEIAAAVSQHLDLEPVFAATADRMTAALDVQHVWITLWDDASQKPALFLQRTGQGETAADAESVEWETLARRALATGRPATATGLAAVPLMAEGKVLGAVGVATVAHRSLAPEELELLAAIGHQIGVAVENARLYLESRHMQDALRDYARQVTQAQEEERKRIARELHDDTAQALVLVARGLDAVSDSGGRLPKAAMARLEEVRSLAQRTLSNVRRFSRDLRPPVLDDLGLVPALEWLASEMSPRTATRVSVRVHGEPRRLAADAELNLFRIAQEALRNVEKHAAASEALVEVVFADGRVEFSVSDNGRGFELSQRQIPPRRARLGLLGMEERAELLGGNLDVRSRPGEGTRVSVTLATAPAEMEGARRGPARSSGGPGPGAS